MSDIKIETIVMVGNISVKTSGKLFKVVGLDGVGLPEMTLNELLDMGKAIDAMTKEMAKVDLSKVGVFNNG